MIWSENDCWHTQKKNQWCTFFQSNSTLPLIYHICFLSLQCCCRGLHLEHCNTTYLWYHRGRKQEYQQCSGHMSIHYIICSIQHHLQHSSINMMSSIVHQKSHKVGWHTYTVSWYSLLFWQWRFLFWHRPCPSWHGWGYEYKMSHDWNHSSKSYQI